MELGNYIKVSKQAIAEVPETIVKMCVWNCLMTCRKYGIEPVGSFEMKVCEPYIQDPEEPPLSYVWYSFISDE